MKCNFYRLMILGCLFMANSGYGQGFAFNTTGATAAPSAMMDVSSTTRGVLLPRMTAAQKLAIATPATGLLIYQTNSTPGFYYYNGSAWTAIAGSGGSGWGLTGNAGTTPGTNYVGTSDNNALVLKVNNLEAGRLSPSVSSTSYGYQSLAGNTANGNTATGYQSMQGNTTGTRNTAAGDSSLYTNTTGNDNTATGYQSLYLNTATGNTAYGALSLRGNTTGAGNTATGDSSLYANTNGLNNTATGYLTLRTNTTGDENTATG